MWGFLEDFRWMKVASEKLNGQWRTPGVNSPWGESHGHPRVWTQHWHSPVVQKLGTWLGEDGCLEAQMDFGKRDVLFPEKIPGDQGSLTPSPTLPWAPNLQLPAHLISRWQWPELLWSLPQVRLRVQLGQGGGEGRSHMAGNINPQPEARTHPPSFGFCFSLWGVRTYAWISG